MEDRGLASRKQPYVSRNKEQWSSDLVVSQHMEALYIYGENCLFTLMWRAPDVDAGLVDYCSNCYRDDRGAQAFNQPPSKKGCAVCYGTGFEGGFRAQVIRPAIFSDRNVEMNDDRAGTTTLDTLQVETTPDFVFRKGDYIFRGDGSRYQAEEKAEGVLRTGFGIPQTNDSFRGSIPVARLEDPTSAAYLLPPTTTDLIAMLDGAVPSDLSGDPETLPTPPTEQSFEFATPTQVWECHHSLATQYVEVLIYDTAGNEMIGEVAFVSNSLTTISWYRPTAGRAVLRA